MINTTINKLCMIITLLIMILSSWSVKAIDIPTVEHRLLQQDSQGYHIYDLLIIAPKIFHNELVPLADHKNRIGIRTILVDTDMVYDQMFQQGRDDAEKVKYFIKDAVENWGVQYVLLVGGRSNQGHIEKWWVPVRYSYLDRPYEAYVEQKFLSDLYFADIYNENGSFSSWDDNGNGVFGEWRVGEEAVDHPDLIPDVSLGRLPCLNERELRIVVQKIIQYETMSVAESWFKTMVVVAGDTYPGRTPYYDGEVYTQQGLDLMTGFNPVKVWASDGSLKSWVDVVSAINKGCGFLWLSGHGNPKSWATHPPDDNKTWISGLRLRNLPFLHNRQKLPVCITGSGCFNSMFNVSLLNSHWVFGLRTPYCISWALMIQRDGGSIATIGATAFSYESPDISLGVGGIEWLDRQFFAEYGRNHTDILGNTWRKAVTAVLTSCPIDWSDNTVDGAALIAKNIEQWVLFGDPSLKIGGYSP
jgi:Peptidase family C25